MRTPLFLQKIIWEANNSNVDVDRLVMRKFRNFFRSQIFRVIPESFSDCMACITVEWEEFPERDKLLVIMDNLRCYIRARICEMTDFIVDIAEGKSDKAGKVEEKKVRKLLLRESLQKAEEKGYLDVAAELAFVVRDKKKFKKLQQRRSIVYAANGDLYLAAESAEEGGDKKRARRFYEKFYAFRRRRSSAREVVYHISDEKRLQTTLRECSSEFEAMGDLRNAAYSAAMAGDDERKMKLLIEDSLNNEADGILAHAGESARMVEDKDRADDLYRRLAATNEEFGLFDQAFLWAELAGDNTHEEQLRIKDRDKKSFMEGLPSGWHRR